MGVEVGVDTVHDPARTVPLAASEAVNAANVPDSGSPCTSTASTAATTIETGARPLIQTTLTQASLDRSPARNAEDARAALVRRTSRTILVDSVTTTRSVGAPTSRTNDSPCRNQSAT